MKVIFSLFFIFLYCKQSAANDLWTIDKNISSIEFEVPVLLTKNVIGKFNSKFSLFETLLSGFPAGTVSGAPKIRAMEIIDELEKNKRKLYAGGIGYFTPNGEFDTCIALRTALIKNNKFYVQAGAGVVADSKPEKEYAETVNKAKALMRAVD